MSTKLKLEKLSRNMQSSEKFSTVAKILASWDMYAVKMNAEWNFLVVWSGKRVQCLFHHMVMIDDFLVPSPCHMASSVMTVSVNLCRFCAKKYGNFSGSYRGESSSCSFGSSPHQYIWSPVNSKPFYFAILSPA